MWFPAVPTLCTGDKDARITEMSTDAQNVDGDPSLVRVAGSGTCFARYPFQLLADFLLLQRLELRKLHFSDTQAVEVSDETWDLFTR